MLSTYKWGQEALLRNSQPSSPIWFLPIFNINTKVYLFEKWPISATQEFT